jgi:hypothetical protein
MAWPKGFSPDELTSRVGQIPASRTNLAAFFHARPPSELIGQTREGVADRASSPGSQCQARDGSSCKCTYTLKFPPAITHLLFVVFYENSHAVQREAPLTLRSREFTEPSSLGIQMQSECAFRFNIGAGRVETKIKGKKGITRKICHDRADLVEANGHIHFLGNNICTAWSEISNQGKQKVSRYIM